MDKKYIATGIPSISTSIPVWIFVINDIDSSSVIGDWLGYVNKA